MFGSLDGLAQKGEALLGLLAELDITSDSYSGQLQLLLMDVSAAAYVLCCCCCCC